MEKKEMNKKRKPVSRKPKLSIDELNAYAEEYFKTHELHPALKGAAGVISVGKTVKQLMSE